jgi:hypothetical protein
METQELLNSESKSAQTSNGDAPVQIPGQDISYLIDCFKTVHGLEKPLKFFLGLEDLQTLSGIPNFKGISIYNGINNSGEEVLLLVGVTEINGVRRNVYSQTFNFNFSQHTESSVVTLQAKATPCPPLPPGATKCPGA